MRGITVKREAHCFYESGPQSLKEVLIDVRRGDSYHCESSTNVETILARAKIHNSYRRT